MPNTAAMPISLFDSLVLLLNPSYCNILYVYIIVHELFNYGGSNKYLTVNLTSINIYYTDISFKLMSHDTIKILHSKKFHFSSYLT